MISRTSHRSSPSCRVTRTDSPGAVSADGFLAHGFTTDSYFKAETLPALERGLAKAGRPLADLEISIPAFVVTGTTEEEMAAAAVGVRRQIAFYGSTPNYRPVLEHHGWGELQTELNTLSKQGEWDRMGDAIDDEVLGTFAVVGPPDAIAPELARRFGGVLDRVQIFSDDLGDPQQWAAVIDAIKRI